MNTQATAGANEQEILVAIAKAKYTEASALPRGKESGRRLELAMQNGTAEKIEDAIVAQIVDIGVRVGADFLLKTPAVVLEQFAITAICRDEDTAGLILSLINSFLLAYMTPETCERAVKHLKGLETLRAELADSRKLLRTKPQYSTTPSVTH